MEKSYFWHSFATVLLAAVFFLGIKRILPDKIFSEKAGPSRNVLVDSMLLDAVGDAGKEADADVGDSLANQPVVYFETNGVTFPEETFDTYTGNQYLIPFFEKLYQLEKTGKGNVRIAYFGDSMTDGDMIVQDLRTALQQKFGGQGVGFVAITSESAGSRSSVIHEFSPRWKTQSYLNVKHPLRAFGVNGHVFFANDTSSVEWVKYKAGKGKFNGALDNPTLFYGNSSNTSASVDFIIGKDSIHRKLAANSLLNTVVVKQGSVKALKANFNHADSIPVYGFNFDDGKGVHVDNFSQRGNSGMPIARFNPALMKAFQDKLGYDLIVLHYGTNVLNYGNKNYGWYEKGMAQTVNKLKESFPGAAILIISSADKATKYDLEMKTDSAVIPLTRSQRRYALATKSGFVDLFTLMGGEGAMTTWTEGDPALANKDYTHFNFRGAKKVAGMLYDRMMQGYATYRSLRKEKEPEPAAPAKKTDSTAVTSDDE